MIQTRKKHNNNNINKNKNNKNNKNKTKTKTKRRVFTKQHYNSGDGMLTSIWGPSMWHYLHTMSFNYPIHPTIDDKKHYMDFILLLQYVLPCKYCRINLKENFKKLPITLKNMKSRETFSKYVYQLHELINKMLHKKSNLSYDDVRERYEHFRSRCTKDELPVIQIVHPVTRKQKGTQKDKEKGCTESLYGKKSKCVIKIVPQAERGATFQMDKKCIKTRKKHEKT